ncbi:MAG: hypothetical protein IJF33_05195, partial [Clostridia bacterium]|nr:hypothetical protein [Clostridia bacterium]
MTENEKRNAPSKASAAEKVDGTENLLSEFGASAKKAPAKSTTKKPTAAVKNADAASPSDERSAEKAKSEKNATTAKVEKKKESTKPNTGADSKKGTVKTKDTQSSVRASTASPKKEPTKEPEKNKKANATEAPKEPRSARPAHKVIPYVLLVLAVFIGISLILNLICNQWNHLENNPSAHWMGAVGYYICYALFGLFGPAVYVLPLLLLFLAFYWKRY